ncbi:MAG: hypothetical protein P8M07_06875, partial [Flavobacteriales bacterium]|nr:hypothetical protein [Flavobacteriales bacterium]
AFSIWGTSDEASAGNYRLLLRQGGTSYPFNIELEKGAFNHIIVNVSNGLESPVPGIYVSLTTHADATEIGLPETGTLPLAGADDMLAMVRAGWHSILWNGAAHGSAECSDPFGSNFAPLSVSGLQASCEYLAGGCTDPEVNTVTDTYDNNRAESGACNYDALGSGELISVRWFSDGSTGSPTEAPAIYKIVDGVESLYHSFQSDLEDVYDASPSTYPYSMPVLTVKLPAYDYRIRVKDSSTQQDATTFTGNFSVRNDRGNEYVNCIQYLTSEVNDGEYDFSISGGGCALTTDNGDLNDLMTDCADCYSVQFDHGSSYLLNLADGLADIGHYGTYAFWFRAPSLAGDIFKITNSVGSVTLKSVADSDPQNVDGIKFQLSGPSVTLSRSPEAPYNEFNLVPGQWYHAALAFGSNAGFTLRSTDLNDGDAEPWNSTREFDFTASDITEPWSGQLAPTSITLGGADVLIHQLSIWSASLSKAQTLALFQSLSTSDLYSSGLETTDGQWVNADAGILPLSSLVSVLSPDNSGRLVDHMSGAQMYSTGTNTGINGNLVFNQWGDLSESGAAIGQTNSGHRSVRRAPWGLCNPGCARVYNACNYNPFANVHGDCQLACAGVTTETSQLVAHPANYDEIRGWTGAAYDVLDEDLRMNQPTITVGGTSVPNPMYHLDYTSTEMAFYWMQRYPNNQQAGLFLMYDADEGLGNVLYDRAKFDADLDAWNHNNANIKTQSHNTVEDTYSQISAMPGGNYFSEDLPRDIPLSLGNWTLSSTESGQYLIPNIKFSGSGNMFDINPSKSTSGFAHLFNPGLQIAMIGDMILHAENKDFTDESAFQIDMEVMYQGIQSGFDDFSGTGITTTGDCPVKGVRFMVDGTVAKDSTDNPIETDALGRATLYIPRGNVSVEPVYTHLDENETSDDHTFASTGLGVSLFISGPKLQAASNQVRFTDLTTRRIVGRIIGGDHQAAKAWDASDNNLGKASFQIVMEKPIEGSASYELAATCPAVQITTDIKGQYDVQVLPGIYRAATSADNAAHPNVFSANSFSNFTLTGWTGAAVSSWIDEFAGHLQDDGSGGYNANDPDYKQWNTTEKRAWDQEATYPGHDLGGEAATPDDAYDRLDFVFKPEPRVAVEQIQPKTDQSGTVKCDTARATGLHASLGNVFIGLTEVEITHDLVKYISPAASYLEGYRRGVQDPAADAYDGTPPFPLGLPVLNSGSRYCTSITAELAFSTSFDDHTFSDVAELYGTDYKVSIMNTLSYPQDSKFIDLDAAGGIAYDFKAAAPTYNPGDIVPRGLLSIQLFRGDQSMATWQPFGQIIDPSTDVSTLPMIHKAPDNTTSFSHNRFDAILMGSFVSAPAVPVSAEPTLEYILRDPPGDASFCSIEAGSVIAYNKTTSTLAGDLKSRQQNLEYVPSIELDGEMAIEPMGIGMSFGGGTEIDPVANVTHQEEYGYNSSKGVDVNETFTFNENVTTSAEPQDMDYGVNQDLFYGKVTNTSMGVTTNFGLDPANVAVSSAASSTIAEDLGLALAGTPSQYVLQDSDGDGYVDYLPFFEANADGSLKLTGGNYSIKQFAMGWTETIKKSDLPASYFMKTQFTIENVDIALLEIARDAYFAAHSDYYTWPDGTSASVPYASLGWTYPDGMKLANNDDHRWELYHQTWMDTRNTADSDHLKAASTLQRGYQIPNTSIVSDLTGDDIAEIITTGSSFSTALATRLTNEYLTGDDRIGPGYRFGASTAQVEAAKTATGDATLIEIDLDSVRYYNVQIAQWKKMLAENELEKISARKFLFSNLASYSHPDSLTNWIENLSSSADIVNDWGLDDFENVMDANGNPISTGLSADSSLWNDADFAPFFISFSGGGAQFTQTLSRTNVETTTRSRELSATWTDTFQAGLTVQGAGLVSDVMDQNTRTETRSSSKTEETSVTYSYTLSDVDESDFFLVAVVPGRGMNGPLFLNLGSVASCPTMQNEPSSYFECYAAVIPSDYNLSADLTACGGETSPVWGRQLNPSSFTIGDETGTAWPIIDGIVIGNDALETTVGADVAILTTTAVVSAAVAVAGIAQIATGNVPGGAATIATGIALAAVGIGDAIAMAVWRDLTVSEFEDQFGLTSFDNDALIAPAVGSENPDLWIHPSLCSELSTPMTDAKANIFEVQPLSVALQVPDVTVSYTTNDGTLLSGLTEVNPPITSLMDQPIGVTMHIKNMAPNPYATDQDFVFYADAFGNTLGANVYIGGSNAPSVEYEISPDWQVGDYEIPVSIHHSGIESEEFMEGQVKLIMLSVCDWNIEGSAIVNVNFEPACSDLSLTAPLDQWTANLDQLASGSYFSNDGTLDLQV